MRFSYFYFSVLFLERCFCDKIGDGWNYINIHCRNNNNKPVDWWYIYKPPGDAFPLGTGLNFTYISSETMGRWVASDVTINRNSMLVNTLLPMYKPSYKYHLAVAVYQNREEKSGGTSARGVLMAAETGGFLLMHTVPDFPNAQIYRPEIPPDETANGHLLVCVSLDSEAINKVAQALRRVSPKFTYVKVPDGFKDWLADWDFENALSHRRNYRDPTIINFQVNGTTASSLTVQPPGFKLSLYKTFAETHQVYLNVYGQSRYQYLTTLCSSVYGVRNIDMISLKFPEKVDYIVNCTDRTWFAVSTAAFWQQKGAGPTQHWTCTSNLDKEDNAGEGGLLLCLQNYDIWRAFDNLKVKEPEC